MHHGLYNTFEHLHLPCIMGCTTVYLLMQCGLYNSIHIPWLMGCTIYIYPMHHELYNIFEHIHLPCYMDCTTVYLLHGRWIVQQYDCSIGHGLYNHSDSSLIPCTMGCTMVCLLMQHGLYNSISIPWLMDCTIHLERFTSHAP